MWSLGAVISFIGNKGVALFDYEYSVKKWPGGRSSLSTIEYSKELRKLTAYLLSPDPNQRPTADEVVNEARKENRQGL